MYEVESLLAASGHLHSFINWLRDLLTQNQAFQDAPDWIKLCGIDERVGADVKKSKKQHYIVAIIQQIHIT